MKMRGQGGVAVMYKEELQSMITVCKEDMHKRYLWVRAHTKEKDVFITGCYIPHRELPFYNVSHIDKNDPFEDLCMDIEAYKQRGAVLAVGDLNARIAHA